MFQILQVYTKLLNDSDLIILLVIHEESGKKNFKRLEL